MSHYFAWIEWLKKLSTPPTAIRFQSPDGSDYELPTEIAAGQDEPGPGTRCSTVGGDRESFFTMPRVSTPKDDLTAGRALPALVKAIAENTGMALVQVVPVMADFRETLKSFSVENAELRAQLNEAYRVAAERGLESVLATAKEKEIAMRGQTWDKLIAIGGRVADGLLIEHSRALMLRRVMLRLKPSTVEQIHQDLGEENFADIAELLFQDARAMPEPQNDGGSKAS